MGYLTSAPTFGRPAQTDQVSRVVEALAAEALDTRDIVVQAGAMVAVNGSPPLQTLANRGVVPSWTLDPTTIMTVGMFVTVPAGWLTFDVVALGATHAAGTGDVTLRGSTAPAGSGASAAVVTTGALATAAAGAVETLQEITLLSAAARPASGALGIAVARRASEAADTLTSAWGLVAVVLRRVS